MVSDAADSGARVGARDEARSWTRAAATAGASWAWTRAAATAGGLLAGACRAVRWGAVRCRGLRCSAGSGCGTVQGVRHGAVGPRYGAVRCCTVQWSVAELQLRPVSNGIPHQQDDWCELRLARSIAAGSYQVSMAGVLGRWGAHAAGGLIIMQVRIGEAPSLREGQVRTSSHPQTHSHPIATPHRTAPHRTTPRHQTLPRHTTPYHITLCHHFKIQVRVHGEWEPLMGAPRTRAGDMEVSLVGRGGLFSVWWGWG